MDNPAIPLLDVNLLGTQKQSNKGRWAQLGLSVGVLFFGTWATQVQAIPGDLATDLYLQQPTVTSVAPQPRDLGSRPIWRSGVGMARQLHDSPKAITGGAHHVVGAEASNAPPKLRATRWSSADRAQGLQASPWGTTVLLYVCGLLALWLSGFLRLVIPVRYLRRWSTAPLAMMAVGGRESPLHKFGDMVGPYQILSPLGSGGSGTTYEARAEDGAKVAIKAISLRGMGGAWKPLELYEREVRVLKSLSHPAIPEYITSFEVDTAEDTTFYLVQRLAEGETLAALVRGGWRATDDQAYSIALQLAEVLVYLSSLNPPVVHRDLKPENIVVQRSAEGVVKVSLVDFGGVVDPSKTATFQTTVIGTFGYMAPEHYRGRASPLSDQYALGAVLLFLASGLNPSDLPYSRMKISYQDLVPLSPRLAAVVDRMLEPVEEDRWPDAQACLEALRAGPQGLKPQESRPAPANKEPHYTAVKLALKDGELVIDIPPEEFWNFGDFFQLCWATTWTYVIALVTFTWLGQIPVFSSMATFFGTVVLLTFLAPFWAVGIGELSSVVIRARQQVKTVLRMDTFNFSVSKMCLGITYNKQSGAMASITDVTVEMDDDEEAIRIRQGKTDVWFGAGLTPRELKWIADEVRKYLKDRARQDWTLFPRPNPSQ
mmetsp:Transcript_137349/g.238884  ORF Transcript_137349/g.238884 Transcript_137349/m.238884 type:complete len:657 (-) Transcript_137349:98-2068(-)